MTATQYWNKYLSDTKQKIEEATFSGELVFENSGITGIEQSFLIQQGKKTCCFTAFDSFAINFEPIPVVGEVYIVEDTNENPVCIIEIDDVQVLPFNQVTWQMAEQEGEDSSLEEWKNKQFEYMSDEADICGFEFTENSKVVFEHFHVIYK